ncbi:MAG: ParB/RepB/Spo0J family partition protein [Phycisphaerales bacterium]|nr:ParB/RepB/Spo0J family partition protein [Phycisphaerales bacterium]
MDRMIREIPITSIVCPPQVREHFDEAALAALAETIKAVGIRQPVTVRAIAPDSWALVVGERRLRAATIAGLTELPAMVIDGDLSDAEILELQLLENCARSDLNPVEKARAYERWMRETNRPAAQLAERVGMSAGNVTKLTTLLLLTPDVIPLVADGRIPMSSAYELARVADHAEQRRLAEEVVAGRLTRDKLVARLRAAKVTAGTPRPRRPRQRTERIVLRLEGGRRLSVSGPGLSVESLVRWIEELLSELSGLEGELTLAQVESAFSRKSSSAVAEMAGTRHRDARTRLLKGS